ncbi:Os04g0599100 [Oryza sativa Japonica Group]|uniref:Os04g0599100 protein n=1 Tax=Oryza sativa subsp. japonica TaxID=39947 RepID=C7J160_ORYSJ|nr:Os04g0599100 [Oryza sativa Japonica Group]|eukprot:NP_001174077.1 Os04g0599100 [Oryza sativa Japonica Group]
MGRQLGQVEEEEAGGEGEGCGEAETRHHRLLAGDHRVGAATERVMVAREDTRARRAPGVSGNVAEDRNSGQAPRP